jgi:putative Mg2+ transporter-C (MgtC) family protein
MDLPWQELVSRLLLATVLCAVIGIEREVHQKPAGIRTNALIGLGSALMTICGILAASGVPGADPSRVGSIVVQGIGFLGAGAIIQSSGTVRGLTTAASMWVVAGIGIAAGFGYYALAVATSLVALVLLAIFGPLDARLIKDEHGQRASLLRRE